MEYLFWQCKNFPVSSELKPPLVLVQVFCIRCSQLFSDWNSNQNSYCKLASYKDAFPVNGTGAFVLQCCFEKQCTNHFVFTSVLEQSKGQGHPWQTE